MRIENNEFMNLEPSGLEPEVIYEDENFLAVNKPAGLLVHEARIVKHETREQTLVGWLLKNYPEVRKVGDDPSTRPGIVHRLDRETSGVMIVARNQKYFTYLKSLFQKHEIKKVYLALVYGRMKDRGGIINKPISIKSGTVKRTAFLGKMTKEAVTDYRVEKLFENFSLLRVMPKTGRTHQIRVHLASVGHPVVNDHLYAWSKPRIGGGRLMLHALSLEFVEARGKRLKIEAEPGSDFWGVVRGLG